jgi:muconolactone delta-isomerase
MRFLVVSKPKHYIPPNAAIGLIDAMAAWVEQNTAEGKFEQVWSFAGIAGGGGIVSVDSLEDLDTIMTAYLFGPFSDTEVLPLVDLGNSLQAGKEAITSAMAAQGA